MLICSRNIVVVLSFIPILLGLIFSPVFFNISILRAAQAPTSVTVVVITVCGNGVKESGEQCDGSNLGGQICTGLGYTGGTLACKADCTFNTLNCTSGGGGGGAGGGAPAPPPPTLTKVIIKGKAYPEAEITLLEDGRVAATKKADSSANFKIEVKDITPGIWTFSLWAEDQEGRKSTTFSFTTNVVKDMATTVSGIFLPPTIELSKVSLQKGETLDIFGQTASESEISISIESEEIVKKTKADEKGDWDYAFDTSPLDEGSHTTRAKATSPEGLLSTFSQTLAFGIGKEIAEMIKKADITGDAKVNLVDFSILLYNWGAPKNPTADLNSDGKVNLVDFSIMLYYWTG